LEAFSTPALEVTRDPDGQLVRRLYIGLTLKSSAGQTGELRCYEDRTGAE
jgi:hypothetical protein